jgi:hypothetical protein
MKRNVWSAEHDAALIAAVAKWGPVGWHRIAHEVGHSRKACQCNARWHNYLRPGIDHAPFSASDDAAIARGVARYGTVWHRIVEALPARTAHALKNRWASLSSRAAATAKKFKAFKPTTAPGGGAASKPAMKVALAIMTASPVDPAATAATVSSANTPTPPGGMATPTLSWHGLPAHGNCALGLAGAPMMTAIQIPPRIAQSYSGASFSSGGGAQPNAVYGTSHGASPTACGLSRLAPLCLPPAAWLTSTAPPFPSAAFVYASRAPPPPPPRVNTDGAAPGFVMITPSASSPFMPLLNHSHLFASDIGTTTPFRAVVAAGPPPEDVDCTFGDAAIALALQGEDMSFFSLSTTDLVDLIEMLLDGDVTAPRAS